MRRQWELPGDLECIPYFDYYPDLFFLTMFSVMHDCVVLLIVIIKTCECHRFVNPAHTAKLKGKINPRLASRLMFPIEINAVDLTESTVLN